MNAKEVLNYLATWPDEGDILEEIINWRAGSDKGNRDREAWQDTLNDQGASEIVQTRKDIAVYKVKKE